MLSADWWRLCVMIKRSRTATKFWISYFIKHWMWFLFCWFYSHLSTFLNFLSLYLMYILLSTETQAYSCWNYMFLIWYHYKLYTNVENYSSVVIKCTGIQNVLYWNNYWSLLRKNRVFIMFSLARLLHLHYMVFFIWLLVYKQRNTLLVVWHCCLTLQRRLHYYLLCQGSKTVMSSDLGYHSYDQNVACFLCVSRREGSVSHNPYDTVPTVMFDPV